MGELGRIAASAQRIIARMASCDSGVIEFVMSVSKTPGTTVFTVMPRHATSRASEPTTRRARLRRPVSRLDRAVPSAR